MSIVAAATTAMVRRDDAKLLAENDGLLSLPINWAKFFSYSLLREE